MQFYHNNLIDLQMTICLFDMSIILYNYQYNLRGARLPQQLLTSFLLDITGFGLCSRHMIRTFNTASTYYCQYAE